MIENADMRFDAKQRRAALQSFMAAAGFKIRPWERHAELGDGTLRKFMKGPSGTLTDRSYQSLADAAASILGRPVSVAELQGDLAGSPAPDANSAHSTDQNRVSTQPITPKALQTAPEPLIVYRSASGEASGGNTLIYKDKVGQIERLDRYRFAKNAFCFEATDDLMRPLCRNRDTIIIDPDRNRAAEDDCVFVKDPAADPLDAVVRHLVRITPKTWVVREHNGRKTDYELSRADFTKAWVVIGVLRV